MSHFQNSDGHQLHFKILDPVYNIIIYSCLYLYSISKCFMILSHTSDTLINTLWLWLHHFVKSTLSLISTYMISQIVNLQRQLVSSHSTRGLWSWFPFGCCFLFLPIVNKLHPVHHAEWTGTADFCW